MQSLLNAYAAWQAAIGAEHLILDPPTRTAAETATYATQQQIPAILRPGNRAEVQRCVEIANQYKVPLYPISKGKNWGYGSRVPVTDGCVLLDLGRLNRIVDFDEKLAYITVEPGVTQQQVFDFLQEQGSNLFLGMAGGPRDSSLIGNTLERGVAKGPYGDRFQHVGGLEVVLPNATCIHTGFGRFAEARAAKTYRWGVGPYLDGLFTQSNLGIVTQMTFWLLPTAPHFQVCFYTLEEESQLIPLFDTLRDLMLRNLINTTFVLSNDYRTVSYSQQYPWAESGGQRPMPLSVRQQLRKKWGTGLWFSEVALYSQSAAQAQIDRQLIDTALRPAVSTLYFVDDEVVQKPPAEMQTLLPGYDPQEVISWFASNSQRGIPSNGAIPMAYWRKEPPLPPTLDPDRDQCGFIWCAPVVPMIGTCVQEVVSIIEETTSAYGYEPSIALNCVNPRNLYATAAIIYDRAIAGEDERAMRCYEELLGRLTKAGYLPYRLGIHAMDHLPPAQDDYDQLLHTLKAALDPNGILSPRRYEFR